jgi:hypothetical protein
MRQRSDAVLAERTTGERMTIWLNRYEEARRAGLSSKQARELADSDRDIGELRELVKAGCPPRLIARIVL